MKNGSAPCRTLPTRGVRASLGQVRRGQAAQPEAQPGPRGWLGERDIASSIEDYLAYEAFSDSA